MSKKSDFCPIVHIFLCKLLPYLSFLSDSTRYVIQVYEDWSPFLENCLGEKYHEFLRLCFCCVNLVHRPKEKKILPLLGSDKRS